MYIYRYKYISECCVSGTRYCLPYIAGAEVAHTHTMSFSTISCPDAKIRGRVSTIRSPGMSNEYI